MFSKRFSKRFGWNLLSVHIGSTETPRGDASFPDSRVDFSRGDVSLTVQLEFAGATVAPLQLAYADLAEITATDLPELGGIVTDLLRGLPRREEAKPAAKDDSSVVGLASSAVRLPPVGDSTVALFGVCPEGGVSRLEGRIAIVHNNRILQTARLSTTVGPQADQGAGLIVASQGIIHLRDDDLDERREYDVAIQVSDVGGKLHLTVQRDGSATAVQLDALGQPIAGVSKALERAAMQWDYSKTMIEQAALFRETLYGLAAHGTALEQELRKKCGNDIDRWERIHLVLSTNEFIPLEYVYDGPPPTTSATVCPNMLDALERGSCDHTLGAPTVSTACPYHSDRSFLCAMHFWGFRRLIERSGAVGAASTTVNVPSKRTYGKVQSILFAASQRAFGYTTNPEDQAAERTGFVEALRVLSSTVSDVADWDKVA